MTQQTINIDNELHNIIWDILEYIDTPAKKLEALEKIHKLVRYCYDDCRKIIKKGLTK